jgi:hypothetical protein
VREDKPEKTTRIVGGSHGMDPAGWTIWIIAIVIVAAIALSVGRTKHKNANQR